MTRKNPEVGRLKAIIASLKRELDDRRRDPGDMPTLGCGDHGCEVRAGHGMGTNGGCRCEARELRQALRWQKRRTAFLEGTIRDMVADHAGAVSRLNQEVTAWWSYSQALKRTHANAGRCPDEAHPRQRDSDCRACGDIAAAEAMLKDVGVSPEAWS